MCLVFQIPKSFHHVREDTLSPRECVKTSTVVNSTFSSIIKTLWKIPSWLSTCLLVTLKTRIWIFLRNEPFPCSLTTMALVRGCKRYYVPEFIILAQKTVSSSQRTVNTKASHSKSHSKFILYSPLMWSAPNINYRRHLHSYTKISFHSTYWSSSRMDSVTLRNKWNSFVPNPMEPKQLCIVLWNYFATDHTTFIQV